MGTGIDEFFEAVEEKRKEFLEDYLPELERRREDREERKKKTRQEELDKMMQGMSVVANDAAEKRPIQVNDDDVDVPSDVDSGDDEEDDETTKEGLQARYAAAMDGKDEGILGDASFAKYLHTQR
jgi:hypothetical protein